MILVDWGNLEETLIILRMTQHTNSKAWQEALQCCHDMMANQTHSVDVIVDMRACSCLPLAFINSIKEQSQQCDNLKTRILLCTPVQVLTLKLIANFYPNVLQTNTIVQSVDEAYQYAS